MTVSRRTRAEIRYSDAQLAEKAAREANDLRGIDAAKVEQVAALDEISAIDQATRTGSDEERVTLVCPNPDADLTDSNGVTFVGGRAVGVRRSLAAKYVELDGGYAIEEGA